MDFIEIPESRVLHGEQAVKALTAFIKETEERKGRKLTKRQAQALIKVAKGLIATIEVEKHSNTAKTNKAQVSFASNLDRFVAFLKR